MKRKLYENAAVALEGLLVDGMTISAGGFGLCGIPENLIAASGRDGGRDQRMRAIGRLRVAS